MKTAYSPATRKIPGKAKGSPGRLAECIAIPREAGENPRLPDRVLITAGGARLPLPVLRI